MDDHSPPPSEPPAASRDYESRLALVREIRRLVRDVALALVVCSLAIVFLFQPFKVEGTSMQPRLGEHERILVNKLIYHLRAVSRGEVVVFWFPGDAERSFIKRVIGVPGDRVEIRAGQVYVNREPLAEPYLSEPFREVEDFGPQVVPPDAYFVLGDHRNVSNDSRSWGPVPRSLIYGKAFLRYWPLTRAGWIE
jgi:signal peptidase I